jgi:NADPH-dependent 2,4-dienoyl-CoA reductase/sulfur reductase-like enzyme
MDNERLIVIGGDAAGMSAASQARRRRPELDIVVFERSPHTSFSACGLCSTIFTGLGPGCDRCP